VTRGTVCAACKIIYATPEFEDLLEMLRPHLKTDAVREALAEFTVTVVNKPPAVCLDCGAETARQITRDLCLRCGKAAEVHVVGATDVHGVSFEEFWCSECYDGRAT